MRETNKAKAAFEDYYNIGHGRSLRALCEKYRLQKDRGATVPTIRKKTLEIWSNHHNWQDRVGERDAEIAVAYFEAIKKKAMDASYAFWPKRVHDLIDLAELLYDEINTVDKRWVPDVKQIGGGEYAERVDIVRFNSPLIREFREALDDIAAEMGERVKSVRADITTGGEPLTVEAMEAIKKKRWEEAASVIAKAGDDGKPAVAQ